MNDAISTISDMYNRSTVDASAVTIVAHSYGGVAAMLAPMLRNHHRGSIRAIITLGAPLQRSVLGNDAGANSLYERLHEFWTMARQRPRAQRVAARPRGSLIGRRPRGLERPECAALAPWGGARVGRR